MDAKIVDRIRVIVKFASQFTDIIKKAISGREEGTNIAERLSGIREQITAELKVKIDQMFGDQRRQMQKFIEEDLIPKVESGIGKIKSAVESRSDTLYQALDRIEVKVKEIESRLSRGDRAEQGVTAGEVAETTSEKLPIDGYDDLGVRKILEQMEGLNQEQLRSILQHEKKNKNRVTIIRAVNQMLKE